MKILVLRGDGFCRWPSASYLSHAETRRVSELAHVSKVRIGRAIGFLANLLFKTSEQKLVDEYSGLSNLGLDPSTLKLWSDGRGL